MPIGSPIDVSDDTVKDNVAADEALAATAAAAASPSTSPGVIDDRGVPIPQWSFAERYEIGERIGAGGMGEVYSCYDRGLLRTVALKVVRPSSVGSSETYERFVREARIQGQLEHPAIVPVHELGLSPDGRPYFVMKRVSGLTLREVLAQRKVSVEPPRRLLDIFSRICQAIGFAHRRGVMHRDLKPENVIIGDFGEVHVLDWGIARVVVGSSEDAATPSPAAAVEPSAVVAGAPNFTSPGTMLGTPQYMAPEQLHGVADERSDVYALGSILNEILTGARLHAREHDTIEDDDDGGGTVPELMELCRQATAFDPTERPSNASVLGEAVDLYLDGDRDLLLRKKMAGEHSKRADEAAAHAFGGDDADGKQRTKALQQVARALSLDPEADGARQTLLRLLTEPPNRMPAEVEEEWSAHKDRAARHGTRIGVFALSLLGAFIPLVLWMGVRSMTAALALAGSAAIAILVTHGVGRRWAARGLGFVLLLVSFGVLLACASLLLGPFAIVPALAVGISSAAPRRGSVVQLAATVVMGLLPLALTLVLEVLGILSPSFDFRDGAMVLLPRLASLPQVPTLVLLVAAQVACVVATALYGWLQSRRLGDAERRMFLHAWQLRQLVPADADADRDNQTRAPPDTLTR